MPIFEENGEPRQTSGLVESEPGLYFVGQHFQHVSLVDDDPRCRPRRRIHRSHDWQATRSSRGGRPIFALSGDERCARRVNPLFVAAIEFKTGGHGSLETRPADSALPRYVSAREPSSWHGQRAARRRCGNSCLGRHGHRHARRVSGHGESDGTGSSRRGRVDEASASAVTIERCLPTEELGWVFGTISATVNMGLRPVKDDENRREPQCGRGRRDRTNQWSC